MTLLTDLQKELIKIEKATYYAEQAYQQQIVSSSPANTETALKVKEHNEQQIFNMRMKRYLQSTFGVDEHTIRELIKTHIPESLI